jgi:hypothetical protein
MLTDVIGNDLPAADLDFLAAFLFADFMDRFFNVTLVPPGMSGTTTAGTGTGTTTTGGGGRDRDNDGD